MKPAFLKLFASFTLLQMIGLLIPLLFVMLISRQTSASEWVAVGVGLAIGQGVSLLVSSGWSLSGASKLMNVESSEFTVVFQESNFIRGVTFTLATPLTATLCLVFCPEEPLVAFLTAIGASANGLSPRWFYLAIAKPGKLVLIDFTPRALAILLALFCSWFSVDVLVQLQIWVAGQLIPILVSAKKTAAVHGPTSFYWQRYKKSVSSMFSSMFTELVAYVYVAIPMIASVVFLSERPASEIASANRVYSLSLNLLVVYFSVAQSLMISGPDLRPRATFGFLSLLFGFIGGVTISCSGLWVSNILFPEHPVTNNNLMLLYGLAFFSVAWGSYTIRLRLLPSNKGNFVLTANAIGLLFACLSLFAALVSGVTAEKVLGTYVVAELVTATVSAFFIRGKKLR